MGAADARNFLWGRCRRTGERRKNRGSTAEWRRRVDKRGNFASVSAFRSSRVAGFPKTGGRRGVDVPFMTQQIWILGASGYVGGAYQRLLRVARHSRSRALPRSDARLLRRPRRSTAALREAKPGVSHQLRRLHRQAERRRLRAAQDRVPLGNAVLPGILPKPARRRARLGVTSPPVAFSRVGAPMAPVSARPTRRISRSARTTALSTAAPKRWAKRSWPGPQIAIIWRLRIPFNEVDIPRNYLTKLMRYDAPAGGGEFDFAAR